jgi:hypothetical protein
MLKVSLDDIDRIRRGSAVAPAGQAIKTDQ